MPKQLKYLKNQEPVMVTYDIGDMLEEHQMVLTLDSGTLMLNVGHERADHYMPIESAKLIGRAGNALAPNQQRWVQLLVANQKVAYIRLGAQSVDLLTASGQTRSIPLAEDVKREPIEELDKSWTSNSVHRYVYSLATTTNDIGVVSVAA